MQIAVIGQGTVGRAVVDQYRNSADVVVYDPAHHDDYPSSELAGCDFGIVCVDTPPADDGSCDVSNVEEAVIDLPLKRILIKSTVAPGTTDRLCAQTGKAICFSPEYIGETPFHLWSRRPQDVPFVIVGGEPAARTWFLDRLAALDGPDREYHACTALEAELIKYIENAFLATKVTFVNEFYEICRAFGADWHTVREGWLMDPRIGHSHSAVFPEDRGFGGRCLPKDLSAIVASSTEAGYRPRFLSEVLASNERFRSG